MCRREDGGALHAPALWRAPALLLLTLVLVALAPGAKSAAAKVPPGYKKSSAREGATAVASCPVGQGITSIYRPVYGNLDALPPRPRCNSTSTYRVLTSMCLRRRSCAVPASDRNFGVDGCRRYKGIKFLSFYYSCGRIRPASPKPSPRPSPKPRRPSPKVQPKPRPSPKLNPAAKRPPPKAAVKRPPPPKLTKRPPPPKLKPAIPVSSPKPTPFQWSDLSPVCKRRAEELLSVFENSSLQPSYSYAENLDDGRGITFGRSGFCTGTGDGVLVVRKYVATKPAGNVLAKYLPSLERINAAGGGDDVTGLIGFVQAVAQAAADPLFRSAQNFYADRLYFSPSQVLAKQYGIRLALTKAQLYDAYIQHGYSDPDQDVYSISANGMADFVKRQLGGTPLTGVDEKLWLTKFLERRRWVLLNTDSEWADSAPRVDVYSWIIQLGGWWLDKAVQLSWDSCRPGNARGPCQPQPLPTRLSIGGVIYGDFLVD